MQNKVIIASEGNYPLINITEINFLFELEMTSCEIGISYFDLLWILERIS